MLEEENTRTDRRCCVVCRGTEVGSYIVDYFQLREELWGLLDGVGRTNTKQGLAAGENERMLYWCVGSNIQDYPGYT